MKGKNVKISAIKRPEGQAQEWHLFSQMQKSKIAVKKPPVRQLRQKILKKIRRVILLNAINKQQAKIRSLLKKSRAVKVVSLKKKIEEHLKKAQVTLKNLFKISLRIKKKRALFLRKRRFNEIGNRKALILFLKRQKVKKVKKIVGFKKKRYFQLLSRISANEILPRETVSFRVFSTLFTKRNSFNQIIEKTILAHRFNKYYSVFLNNINGVFNLNSYLLPWFRPEVAFYKKRRFFISSMLTSLLRKYYLRPDHLRSKRGLRSWILFTPVLRISKKILIHDLSGIYPKKINVLFKLDL